MILFVESSAVLSWLFGEPESSKVTASYESAELVAASRLTLVECSRALHRASALKTLESEEISALEQKLAASIETWLLLDLDIGVMDRASREFPLEPIRSLDALHLATASSLAESIGIDAVTIASLDQRLRLNASEMGFRLLPE